MDSVPTIHAYAFQIVAMPYPIQFDSFLQLICRVFGGRNFLGVSWPQPSRKTNEKRPVKGTLPHGGQIRVGFADVVVAIAVRSCVDRVSHETLRALACRKRACSRQQRLPWTAWVGAKAVLGPPSPFGSMCSNAGRFASHSALIAWLSPLLVFVWRRTSFATHDLDQRVG